MAVDSGNEIHYEGLAFVELEAVEFGEHVVAVSLFVAAGNVLVLSEDIEWSLAVCCLGRVGDCTDECCAVCFEDIHLACNCVKNGDNFLAIAHSISVASFTTEVDGSIGCEEAEAVFPSILVVAAAVDSLPITTCLCIYCADSL